MGVSLEKINLIRIEEEGKKKIYVCACKRCGKEIRAPRQHLRLYCEECGREVDREKRREWKRARRESMMLSGEERRRNYTRRGGFRKTIKPKVSIEEINAAARAAGMSYGAWVAMHHE